MPVEPTPGDVHVDMALTQISIAFMQAMENFVADRVFPVIGSDKKSNVYFNAPRGEFNRNQMRKKAPGTRSAAITWAQNTDNFNAEVRAIHAEIPDEVRANEDAAVRLNTQATFLCTLQAMIDREVDWVQNFFTPANPGVTWTFAAQGNASASASFDPTNSSNNNKVFWDAANSTPIEDIRQGKRFVGEETGFRPNTLTLGRPVYDVLLDHPDIVGRLDRGQTTGPAIVMRQNLAELFEVDQVLVMDAIQNTAAKGASAAHSFIGGKHALLSYAPPSPGILIPSAGYTFAWTGYLGASPNGVRIRNKRDQLADTDWIEADSAYDHKKVSADLGYMFNSITQ